MKHALKAQSQVEYEQILTNNSVLPLIVLNNTGTQLEWIDEFDIYKKLGLENIQGEQTEETNYINQLDDLLGTYGSAE